ncbi:MAG: protein kinase [Myxococcota bacterium]
MPRNTSAELEPGEILCDRYQVLEHIGRGGMGSVYRAHDRREGHEVALKLLTAAVTDGAAVVRFKREFRSASRLHHPSCVQVYDLDRDGDRWLFTMEYVPGRALDVRGGRARDLRVVASLGLQALAALDHIHAQQIVHRDIKPHNMLVVDREGEPPLLKLTDFGISKLADMDEQPTVGSFMGSLPYMAPEQAAQSQVDPRSDLYSLGVVLYLALTGVHPLTPAGQADAFRPSITEWCRLKISDDARPLREVAPQLPDKLIALVDRMLDRDPSRRPSTAVAAYEALKEAVESAAGAISMPQLPPLARASYLAVPRLVGRDDEVERMQRFLERQLGDSSPGGGLFVICGEAGVGKSKLAAQLPGMVRGLGGELYAGTCRAEGGAAYDPLRYFLGAVDRRVRSEEAAEAERSKTDAPPRSTAESDVVKDAPATLATTAFVSTSARTAAVSSGQNPDRMRSGSASEFEPRLDVDAQVNQLWQFQREVAEGLRSLAEDTPRVVLVEDVHWADAAPLELLVFLLRAAHAVSTGDKPVRWAVIVTHRPSPFPSALGWLHEVAEELGGFEKIELEPLARSATAELVASVLMRSRDDVLEHFVERLIDCVGSKPLDVTQALYSLVAHGKLVRRGSDWALADVSLEDADVQKRVQSAIGDRAARFSADTKRALASAAVLGRVSDLESLRHVTRVDEALLLDCVDEAIRAKFLEEVSPGAYMFSHSRLRDAILDELPDDVLRSLHARAAEHLIVNRRGDDPSTIAHHCAQARNFEDAFRYGRIAAHDAMASYAFSRAAALYQDAVRYREASGHDVSLGLRERFGTACLQAGRYDDANAAFSECIEQTEDPVRRAELLRKSADVEFRRPDMVRARERLEQLLISLGFSVPRTASSVGLGIARQGSALVLSWLRAPEQVQDEEQKRRLAMISSTCASLTEAYYFSDFNRAVYYQASSINTAEKVGPSPELAVGGAQAGFIVSTFGQYKRGFRYLERAEEAARTAATPVEAAWEAIMRAMAYQCQGDPGNAVLHTGRAEALLQRSAEPLRVRQAWTIHGEALNCLGRYDQTLNTSRGLERLALELDDRRALGWARYIEGHARWRKGDRVGGLDKLRDGAQLNAETGDLANGSAALGRWVLALALAGHVDEALEQGRAGVVTLIDKKLRNPTVTLHGAFLVAAAMANARSPLDRGLRKDVRRAITAGRRYSSLMLFARPSYLAGLAAWEHSRGNTTASARHLDHARQLAERLGMVGEAADVVAIQQMCPVMRRDRALSEGPPGELKSGGEPGQERDRGDEPGVGDREASSARS